MNMFGFIAKLFGKKNHATPFAVEPVIIEEEKEEAQLPSWERVDERTFYPVGIRAREISIHQLFAQGAGLKAGDRFLFAVEEGSITLVKSMTNTGILLRPERKGSTTLVMGSKALANDLAEFNIRKGKTYMYATQDIGSFVIKF